MTVHRAFFLDFIRFKHSFCSASIIKGDDYYTLTVYGTSIYTFFLYWAAGMIYTSMDLINKPAALKRYKIQPGTNEPVDTKKLIQVIFTVIFNQTVVGVPFALFSYYALIFRGTPEIRELPTFHRFVY